MVSPYALLKASKPKQPASLVTPYDLYSVAQNEPAYSSGSTEKTQKVDIPSIVPPPVRKTHYIHDIGLRHNQALRRTSLTQTPID